MAAAMAQSEEPSDTPAPASMKIEGRVLAGALEMRHAGDGRGHHIVARADMPAAAILLQASVDTHVIRPLDGCGPILSAV